MIRLLPMNRSPRWTLLDRIAAHDALALPDVVFAELADRLREAMADKDPGAIRTLSAQLTEILDAARTKAAPEAVRAAQGDPVLADQPSRHAFALGRLSFAQRIAAMHAERRADQSFEEMLTSRSLGPYVRALFENEMTGVDLAAALSHQPETVSRNLKRLRELGAVDFRREGTSLINFLTPAAQQLAEQGLERAVRTRLPPQTRAWVNSENREMPAIMRKPQTFGHEVDGAEDRALAE